MRARIAIVGGGAAGIFAALGAREHGAEATILERNPRLGIKILISGGGRCNITHEGTPEEIERGFRPKEGRFLRYALHELPPSRVIGMLNEEGVATFTRPNGRVFPESGRAEDVLGAFERMLERAGAEVRTKSPVEGIVVRDGVASGVRIGGAVESFDGVIVATGGMSYRSVGTTGDGIRWAGDLGLGVEPVRAALAPVDFPTAPPREWQGVALRDIVLRVEVSAEVERLLRRDGLALEWRDDALLTHRGLSGPATLEVSRAVALARERGSAVELVADLLPDLGVEELQERWEQFRRERPRAEVQTFVETAAPRAVAPYLLAQAGAAAGTRCADVDRATRARLFTALKGWRISPAGTVPLDRGEVTAGGVSLSEVDPRTMRARSMGRLYYAGEALDVAGSVGGYNLQAAFATGYVAGRAAAHESLTSA